jgi:hypothetical protein
VSNLRISRKCCLTRYDADKGLFFFIQDGSEQHPLTVFLW